MASFKVEVVADDSGYWVANQVRFPSEGEATAYARALTWRWTLVREWRVAPSDDPVNSIWVDGRDLPIAAVSSETIVFTRGKRDGLRKAHAAAVKAGAKEFDWEGHKFVTDYAKYLLEYLDTKFGK